MISNINETKVLLTVFLLAVFLRIVCNVLMEGIKSEPFLFLSGEEYSKRLDSDEIWYDSAARGFLNGKGVVTAKEKTGGFTVYTNWFDIKNIGGGYIAHRFIPPLYPLFLALCYRAFGVNTAAYFIPQAIIGAMACVFTYLLAKEIFDRKVAVVSAFIMTVYPELILWTKHIRVETLFILLLISGFWLLLKGNSEKRSSLVYMSAIIFGLASLTRATFILFIPILFLWQVFFFSKERKNDLKTGLVMLALIILVMVPWCLRNSIVFNKFTPFTDEIGIIITGPTGEHLTRHAEIGFYYSTYKSETVRTAMFIKNHFMSYIALSLERFAAFWGPSLAATKKSTFICKIITWITIFPLAFLGMTRLSRRWAKAGLIAMFIFFYSLIHAGSFVDEGLVYRYPILPFLYIFAAYAFQAIYETRRKFRRKD